MRKPGFFKSRIFGKLGILASALSVACLGLYFLTGSNALTPTGTIEPELASITSPASIVSDATASNGSAVKFMSAATPPPSGSMPTRSNTGPRSATTSTVNGDVNITSPQNISKVHYTGSVNIYAGGAGSTFSDVIIDGAVLVNASTNLTFNYSSIAGFYVEGGSNINIDHSFFGDQNDTFMQISPDNTVADHINVSNSLFAGLQNSLPGSKHLQALHMLGTYDSTFTNNVFDVRTSDPATLDQISSSVQWESLFNGRPDKNISMIGNYFYGGVYQQISPSGDGNIFTNNKFNTNLGPDCGHMIFIGAAYRTPVSQSGNTCDGAPFSLP